MRIRDAALLVVAATLLSGCGGAPRAATPAGEGPDLEVAILTCNSDRVKALVEEDPTIIDVKPRGRYQFPIAIAAQASRICGSQIFSYLLDRDPQMNVILLNEALKSAAGIGDTQMVAVLLKHGADPNGTDSDSGSPGIYPDTPLRAALGNGWWAQDPARNLAVAEQLVAAGARLDVISAAALGKVKVLRALLNQDPKLAVAGRQWDWKPMDWAGHFHQREAARVLLEYIPNPSLRDIINAGDERGVREYLEHHPGVAKVALDVREYAITVAVHAGEKEIAKLLLDQGADVNTGRMMEETIRRGDVEMVKFLIDHGASVKDRPGHQPLLEVANNAHHPEIADIIRQAQ